MQAGRLASKQAKIIIKAFEMFYVLESGQEDGGMIIQFHNGIPLHLPLL